jgi:methionyl-tRNA formyltransferase
MFYLEEGADTGDVIAQREYSIDPEDDRTVRSNLDRLAKMW